MTHHIFRHRSWFYALALLLLVSLFALTPLLVRSQTAPTATPTATIDTAFVEECRRKLDEVLYFQGEVDAGRQDPDLHLDDAKNNYENFGCTWDMFIPTATPTLSVTLTPTTTPAATAIDPAFLAECQKKAKEVEHYQAEVDAGREDKDLHLDDAINNFLNHGCTWEMFQDPVTATPGPTLTPQAAAVGATPTVDMVFMENCRRQLGEVQHFQAEVDAGRERPDLHLDDAVYNFLNLGCTWNMFD